MKPPTRMSEPSARECRCESCGHTDWVSGPVVAPTIGIICDVCRREPCTACEGPMRPTHPYVLKQFEAGATNA